MQKSLFMSVWGRVKVISLPFIVVTCRLVQKKLENQIALFKS